jgi:hypothetical protein
MAFNVYLNHFAGEKQACDLQDKHSTGYTTYIAVPSGGVGMILLLLLMCVYIRRKHSKNYV